MSGLVDRSRMEGLPASSRSQPEYEVSPHLAVNILRFRERGRISRAKMFEVLIDTIFDI